MIKSHINRLPQSIIILQMLIIVIIWDCSRLFSRWEGTAADQVSMCGFFSKILRSQVTCPGVVVLCKLHSYGQPQLVLTEGIKNITTDFFEQFPVLANSTDLVFLAYEYLPSPRLTYVAIWGRKGSILSAGSILEDCWYYCSVLCSHPNLVIMPRFQHLNPSKIILNPAWSGPIISNMAMMCNSSSLLLSPCKGGAGKAAFWKRNPGTLAETVGLLQLNYLEEGFTRKLGGPRPRSIFTGEMAKVGRRTLGKMTGG